MTTYKQARELANSWHSGQWSALYAFSSTGRVPNFSELQGEILDCIRQSQNNCQIEELIQLYNYIDTHFEGDEIE